MTPIIEARNLTKSFGPGQGIEDLSLAIGKGEIFGYLGPNGSGKTTTIRLMLGFLRADRGEMRLFDHKVTPGRSADRAKIGYLPGELGLPENLTGFACLNFYRRLSGGRAPHLEWLCKQLQFSEVDGNKRIATYSKGMKQKIGIIQALQHDPELAILDEPTTGLDPLAQESFFDILHELRDRGRSVFFSSHVLGEVQRVCDRVGVLREGRLVLNSTMTQMAAQAERLLWVKIANASDSSIAEAGSVPSIAKARFVRADAGGWLLYLASASDSPRILQELARLNPIDFRFEPALEEAFLKLYGINVRTRIPAGGVK